MAERINTRRLTTDAKLVLTPLTLPRGADGVVLLMHFGVAVFFNVNEQERGHFSTDCCPRWLPPMTGIA